MARPCVNETPRDVNVVVRVLPAERERWKAAAARAGESLSQWIRRLATAEAEYLEQSDEREGR